MTTMTDTGADQRAQRSKIIHRHCRMQTGDRAGTPKFCNPSKAEIAAATRTQYRPPIIFDSLEEAEACSAELAELDGVRMTTYVCPRSKSGHAHLGKPVGT
jgi:hypothetical protein